MHDLVHGLVTVHGVEPVIQLQLGPAIEAVLSAQGLVRSLVLVSVVHA